ncbi:MAG: membrane protein insertase YidC [Bryobacteraceae bacterium]
MADTPTQAKPTGPQEPNTERNLLLAFILMGVVLFLMPYFYKNFGPAPQPAKPAPAAATQSTEQPAPAKPAEVLRPAPVAGARTAAPRVSAEKEQSLVVETDLYKIVLSNRGAVVRSWVLKKYKDNEHQPIDLVDASAALKTGFPFSLRFKDPPPAVDLNQALYAVKPAPDGLGADFDYSDGALVAHKTFRFQPKSYLSEVASEVAQGGAPLAHAIEWRGAFGDSTAQNAATAQNSVHYDLVSGKLVVRTIKDAKNGPNVEWGAYSFVGIQDKYFAAVFLPHTDGPVEAVTLSDDVAGAPHAGIAVGGAAANKLSVFVGPKDLDILKKVSPKLEQVVDFGTWFGWAAKPLFLIVSWFDHNLVHNYGWSIVLVTIVINFLLLPLKFSSMKSMKKMQALKPQIDAINAKYKGIGMRDPKKAEQNQEVMDFYKKHGVNPMGGCLPMLVQFPFFIAFYNVLSIAIEMRGAHWLWVTDLSQPEHLPIHVLPVLMIVAQYAMQKMTPTPGQDPSQAKVMQWMPVVFGAMFYNMPSGLVLYWLTSNLVGIAQQWFINQSMPLPAPPVEPPAAPKRKKGGNRG